VERRGKRRKRIFSSSSRRGEQKKKEKRKTIRLGNKLSGETAKRPGDEGGEHSTGHTGWGKGGERNRGGPMLGPEPKQEGRQKKDKLD